MHQKLDWRPFHRRTPRQRGRIGWNCKQFQKFLGYYLILLYKNPWRGWKCSILTTCEQVIIIFLSAHVRVLKKMKNWYKVSCSLPKKWEQPGYCLYSSATVLVFTLHQGGVQALAGNTNEKKTLLLLFALLKLVGFASNGIVLQLF